MATYSPISMWIRFETASIELIDPSLFEPLLAVRDDLFAVWHGRVIEFPQQCILITHWRRTSAYEIFKASDGYATLINSIKALGPGNPEIQTVEFGRIGYTTNLGPHTEIFTVYFQNSISEETRNAVVSLRGLVLSMPPAFNAKSVRDIPMRSTPSRGWVPDQTSWNNQAARACVWIHYWKNEEAENRYKSTEIPIYSEKTKHIRLAVDAFEQNLRELGALGWTSSHVNFHRVR